MLLASSLDGAPAAGRSIRFPAASAGRRIDDFSDDASLVADIVGDPGLPALADQSGGDTGLVARGLRFPLSGGDLQPEGDSPNPLLCVGWGTLEEDQEGTESPGPAFIPQFPLSCFPPLLAEALRIVARSVNVGMNFVICSLVAVISALCCGRIRVQFDSAELDADELDSLDSDDFLLTENTTACNLSIVLVGDPGVAKTKAAKMFVGGIHRDAVRLQRVWDEWARKKDEFLRSCSGNGGRNKGGGRNKDGGATIEDWLKENPEPTRPRVYFIFDPTPEAISDSQSRHPSGVTLFIDELGMSARGQGGRHSGSGGMDRFLAKWLSGDSDALDGEDRKDPTRSVHNEHNILGAIAGCQPGLLHKIFPGDEGCSNGIFQRIIFAWDDGGAERWDSAQDRPRAKWEPWAGRLIRNLVARVRGCCSENPERLEHVPVLAQTGRQQMMIAEEIRSLRQKERDDEGSIFRSSPRRLRQFLAKHVQHLSRLAGVFEMIWVQTEDARPDRRADPRSGVIFKPKSVHELHDESVQAAIVFGRAVWEHKRVALTNSLHPDRVVLSDPDGVASGVSTVFGDFSVCRPALEALRGAWLDVAGNDSARWKDCYSFSNEDLHGYFPNDPATGRPFSHKEKSGLMRKLAGLIPELGGSRPVRTANGVARGRVVSAGAIRIVMEMLNRVGSAAKAGGKDSGEAGDVEF